MRGGHQSTRRSPSTSNISNEYRIDSWQIHKHKAKYIEEDPEEYKGTDIVICAKFGCGQKISLSEQLCGKLCIGCQGEKGIDIIKGVKFNQPADAKYIVKGDQTNNKIN